MTLILSLNQIYILNESNGEIAYTSNEGNFDAIVNDITLELNDIALELLDGDITDIYEAGGDD